MNTENTKRQISRSRQLSQCLFVVETQKWTAQVYVILCMKLLFQLLVFFLPVQTQLIKQLFRSRNFLSTPSNLIKMGICLSVSNVSHRIEHKKYLKRIKPFLHQHHQYHHFNYHNFHNTQCIIVSYRDSSPHKQTAWQPGIKIFRLQ